MNYSHLQGKSFWGFKYAFKGLWYAIKNESHFRFHIAAFVGTGMFTEYFDLTRTEYMFFALAVALVLICELVNTAIENAVDISAQEFNIKAQIAKDVSASFVLVAAFFALFVAAMLFLNKDLLANLLDTFTRPKYIIYYILTIIFVRGIGKNGK